MGLVYLFHVLQIARSIFLPSVGEALVAAGFYFTRDQYESYHETEILNQ